MSTRKGSDGWMNFATFCYSFRLTRIILKYHSGLVSRLRIASNLIILVLEKVGVIHGLFLRCINDGRN